MELRSSRSQVAFRKDRPDRSQTCLTTDGPSEPSGQRKIHKSSRIYIPSPPPCVGKTSCLSAAAQHTSDTRANFGAECALRDKHIVSLGDRSLFRGSTKLSDFVTPYSAAPGGTLPESAVPVRRERMRRKRKHTRNTHTHTYIYIYIYIYTYIYIYIYIYYLLIYLFIYLYLCIYLFIYIFAKNAGSAAAAVTECNGNK